MFSMERQKKKGKIMVKIGTKDVELNPNAYCLFEYVNLFDSEYLEDLELCRKRFNKVINKDTNKQTDPRVITETIKLALQIAYVMQDDEKKKEPFKLFTKNIKGLMNDLNWIHEVIAIGYEPFRWNIPQSNINEINK